MRESPRLQRRALAMSLDYYREAFDAAKAGMAAAYATGDYTMQTIADVFWGALRYRKPRVSGK